MIAADHQRAVREAKLGMIAALIDTAAAADLMATELIEAASFLDGQPLAEVMRGLAGCHRVEALRLRERLAGIVVRGDERDARPR